MMRFRGFALLFVVRACMSVLVTINGTEVDCEGTCACCNGGTERCRSFDAYCLDGCVDTITGNSCKSLCKENCLRCEHEEGRICYTCKNYFYELSSFCTKHCSVGCDGGICNDNGTCGNCLANFEGNNCDTCIQGKYGPTCLEVCDHLNCRCIERDRCDSCKAGFYDINTYCQTQCSTGCVNAVCNGDGSCSCLSGFKGSTCSECISGRHGQNCNKSCSAGCVNGQCLQDGTCSCYDSFTGPTCETCVNCKDGNCRSGLACISGCIDGFYGLDCSKSCFSVSLDCVRCNQTDGKCLNCFEGLYPHEHGNCMSCNRNCKNGKCNSETGSCIDGCEEMFWGDKCDIPCDLNCETCKQDSGICDACANTTFHGVYCNKTCSSSCFERKCERGTGHCFNGCSGDFFGNSCQTKCPVNCLRAGTETSCSPVGYCKYGCIDGFEGADCSVPVISPDPPVAAVAGGLIGGFVVIIGVVVAIVFVVLRSSRLSASNKGNTNGKTRVPANMTDERAKQRSSNSPGQDYEHLDRDQRRTSQEQRVYEMLEITPDKQDPARARREEGDRNYESIHDYYNARI
ncbi:multiple epidermal growth factor-like domains protein 10 [Mya arenaria]|uniref:multiple epidermal growth factor-like domains protein 10 n=1 Tax=Mya arenaria TaxID=6604 RepID=UPI0022E9630C|nr:multiple epidermal growth factor-like domains protein 10 [Mya arenaria]